MREHVDLPTVEALNEEWRLRPPVHHLVAAYLDYKPKDQPVAGQSSEPPDIGPMLGELGNVPIRHVMPIDTSAFDAAVPVKATEESKHG